MIGADSYILPAARTSRPPVSGIRLVVSRIAQPSRNAAPQPVHFSQEHRSVIAKKATELSFEFARALTAMLIERLAIQWISDMAIASPRLARANCNAIVDSICELLHATQTLLVGRGPYGVSFQCENWYRARLAPIVNRLSADFCDEVDRWLNWRAGMECSVEARSLQLNLLPEKFSSMVATTTIDDALRSIGGALQDARSKAQGLTQGIRQHEPRIYFRQYAERLVSLRTATIDLGISEQEMRAMIARGDLPAPVQLLGATRWRGSALAAAAAKVLCIPPDVLSKSRCVDWLGRLNMSSMGWQLDTHSFDRSELSAFLAVPLTRLDSVIAASDMPPATAMNAAGVPLWRGQAMVGWLERRSRGPHAPAERCMAGMPYGERLMRTKAVIDMLGLTELQFQRCDDFPAPIWLDAHPRWQMTKVLAWVDSKFPIN